MKNCNECPRNCGAEKGLKTGYCRSSGIYNIASICVHAGEEPPVSGPKGICNIFFSSCNMSCIYCQNYQISSRNITLPDISKKYLLDKISAALASGSGTLGFVSPSHSIKTMIDIIESVKKTAPETVFIMNTNAYDKVETIRSLDGLIDVYLPDFKYSDPHLALEYSDAPGYPETAIKAISEMKRQKGTGLNFDEDKGIVTAGLIIRHMILPGAAANTAEALQMIAEDISPRVHLSLMSQYRPTPGVAGHPFLGRRIYPHEYEAALESFNAAGFNRGWTQELSSPESYTPDFNREHPFE